MIWEPVLPTDFGAPSTATLRRVSDLRASQYWDKEHVVSRLLGERDRKSVVWDYVAVYQPGKLEARRCPRGHRTHGSIQGLARMGLVKRRSEAPLRANDGSIRWLC